MRIYCSGIGGIGLSAYAALQNAAGHDVSGSDSGAPTALTEDLRSQGIAVFPEQDGSRVLKDADLFVYSEAIPEMSPERVKARERGILQQSYFQALGELSKEYVVIAICGTHGKSTTTAMTANMLIDAGRDPTVIVGTKVPQLHGRNWRKGSSGIFVLEACEYRKSFLNLYPDFILMTNVDGDHFDAFADVEDYQRAFREFAGRLPDGGVLITHMGDQDSRRIAEDLCATRGAVRVLDADAYPLPELSIPGVHMRKNAQLVAALGDQLGIVAAKSLRDFSGTWRRFELKGFTTPISGIDPIPVIDDYAHHPKEIAATIGSAREQYPNRRIVCLFQPHTHHRTLRLFRDFCSAFRGVGLVVLADVYDARPDRESGLVDIGSLVSGIAEGSGVDCIRGGSLGESEKKLRSVLRDGDVVLVMGAGDVTTVAASLARQRAS